MKKKKLKKKYDYAVKVNKHLLTELEEANRHMKSQDHEIEQVMSGILVRDQMIDKLKAEIEDVKAIAGSKNMLIKGLNKENIELRKKADYLNSTLTPECRETRKG